MDLTYALGLLADHEAESAGAVINHVWAERERDPELRARIAKAQAIEGSNAKRLAREFRAVTGMRLVASPLARAQGELGGRIAAALPRRLVRSLLSSRLLDTLVSRYWGAKIAYGDPRGRELFRAMITTHHAEFDVLRGERPVGST